MGDHISNTCSPTDFQNLISSDWDVNATIPDSPPHPSLNHSPQHSAYDTVNRASLFAALVATGVPSLHLRRLLDSIPLILGDQTPIRPERGIPQGLCLGPLLFNFFLARCVTGPADALSTPLCRPDFIDDVARGSGNVPEASAGLREMLRNVSAHGLLLNSAKSCALISGSGFPGEPSKLF